MRTEISCSHCHTMNPIGAKWCTCGHRADLPRASCDCPTCRGITVIGLIACQIYEFNDHEDGKTYFWNATIGRQIAEERGGIVTICLPDMGMTMERFKLLAPDLDTRKALTMPVDVLLEPLLFVTHRDDKCVLIDGWHRLYLALSIGLEILPAYVLTAEETAEIVVA